MSFFCSRTQTYTDICLLFSCLVVSDSLQLHAQQYTRLPCSSLPPGACSDFMSVESVMTPNHLILFQPLLLLPSIFPSVRVFSNESALHIRWSRYWSFSFSIKVLPVNIQDWFPWLGSSAYCSRDFQESFSTPQLKASILHHSAFFMFQFSHP